jgi:hypothetical protein
MKLLTEIMEPTGAAEAEIEESEVVDDALVQHRSLKNFCILYVRRRESIHAYSNLSTLSTAIKTVCKYVQFPTKEIYWRKILLY